MTAKKPKNKSKERIRFSDLPLEDSAIEEEDSAIEKEETGRKPISYSTLISLPEEPHSVESPPPPPTAPRPEIQPPEEPQLPEPPVAAEPSEPAPPQAKPEAEEALPTLNTIPDEGEPKVLYEEIYKVTNRIYQAAAEGASLDINLLPPVAEELVASVVRPEEVVTDSEGPPLPSLYREVISSIPEPLDWAAHAVHVATLSVKLGAGLGYSQEELAKLALAGLMHGVGMMTTPRSLLEQPGPLSSQQRSLIESHPIRGAELLSGLGPKLEWLQTVVLQEHERHKGQGYPNKLSGKDIHEFARFIGLVDTFISMTHPRPWRAARSPHEAAREIVFARKDEFDRRLIKLFLQKMTIFPLNSLVKLSNHAIGKVLVAHEDSPLRPTIEILHDPQEGHPAKPRVLDLRKHPLLYIIGAVTEEAFKRRQAS